VVASAPLMHGQLTRGLPPQLREAFPALTTDAQRALAFVRAMPGVTAALVGMRSAAHVGENLEAGRA
jgi:aryl-alcohol dehydrogenase-like predicted oxidoreductase